MNSALRSTRRGAVGTCTDVRGTCLGDASSCLWRVLEASVALSADLSIVCLTGVGLVGWSSIGAGTLVLLA